MWSNYFRSAYFRLNTSLRMLEVLWRGEAIYPPAPLCQSIREHNRRAFLRAQSHTFKQRLLPANLDSTTPVRRIYEFEMLPPLAIQFTNAVDFVVSA